MKKQFLKISVLLLILVLVVTLTLAVANMLNPIFFWVLAGLAAVFAFKILPRMGQ